MKYPTPIPLVVLALACTVHPAHAQSTAWNYQGHLTDGGAGANGLFDMSFGLFTTDRGGDAVMTVTNAGIEVVGGLFTTTLDFGAEVFDGTDYWLEIGVEPGGGGGFTSLSPRQPLNNVPYAIHAKMAMDVVNPTFLGTTTDAPLEFFVRGERVMKLERNLERLQVNIVGGSPLNKVSGSGNTVAGGGADWSNSYYDLDEDHGANIISGGEGGTIAGGLGNKLTNTLGAVIAGGRVNHIVGPGTNPTIGGGGANRIVGQELGYGAGYIDGCTISGGGGDNWSAVGNLIYLAPFSTISGGSKNTISTRIGNLFSMGATISGGAGNVIMEGCRGATISGGGEIFHGNDHYSYGEHNEIGPDAPLATISGGNNNRIAEAAGAVVGGGVSNHTLPGAFYSVITGGLRNTTGTNAQIATIGGGARNTNAAVLATISGGSRNTIGIDAEYATIGGGISNTASNRYSTISGGGYNQAVGYGAVVAGGGGLAEDAEEAPNKAQGRWSAVGGGALNAAIGDESTIAGGTYNVARGTNATIPGGFGNVADGDFSFAAGWNAQANHAGSFVWADDSPFVMTTSTNKEFVVRATGGVRLVTAIDSNGAPTAGVSVSAGGTGWDVISDRNMKENFEPVDGKAVLEQVAAMPIQRWNMKSQPDIIRHIGPMAQDFHTAFGLGETDKRINTVDADGVALAAIQGLHALVREQQIALDQKDTEIESLKKLMANLSQRLDAMEMNRLE